MKSHIGEIKKSRHGLTLMIKKWYNRENVQVEILETHETKWVTYHDFRKGNVTADLLNHPLNNDCTFTQAKIFTTALIGIILAFIGGLIYFSL